MCWIPSIERYLSSSQFSSFLPPKTDYFELIFYIFNILSVSAGELPALEIIDSFFWNHLYQRNDHGALNLMSWSCIPLSISDIRFWWQWRHILYDCLGSTMRPSNIIALCCKNKCLMNTRGDKMRVVSTLSGKKANRFWWSPLFFYWAYLKNIITDSKGQCIVWIRRLLIINFICWRVNAVTLTDQLVLLRSQTIWSMCFKLQTMLFDITYCL